MPGRLGKLIIIIYDFMSKYYKNNKNYLNVIFGCVMQIISFLIIILFILAKNICQKFEVSLNFFFLNLINPFLIVGLFSLSPFVCVLSLLPSSQSRVFPSHLWCRTPFSSELPVHNLSIPHYFTSTFD